MTTDAAVGSQARAVTPMLFVLAAFSGAAGEVRGEVIGGNLHIFADANADMVADFEIVLADQTAIAPSDFIF